MKLKKLIIFIYLLVGCTHIGWSQQASVKKPNIIFILVDDLGYGDLGVLFQKLHRKNTEGRAPFLLTPNLDQMAADGALLPHHYAAAPVCAPSRASILCGVSQGHANVRDNQFDKALEDNYTLGNVLQTAGYRTAAIGKWGLQGQAKERWLGHPLKRGFDYYFGYISHGDGHEHYPKEGLYRGSKKVWDNYDEISETLDKCYTGDLFTAVAKKYIVDHQKEQGDTPFFMYLAYDTPHAVLELPTQAYPEGSGLNGGLQWLGKPGHMINTASGEIDSYVYPEYANATYDHDNDPETPEIPWPDTYKRHASVTFRLDEQIGDLLQLLRDLKIDDNTLVVFSSDNGPAQESYLPKPFVSYRADFFKTYGPFDGIKRDLYEGGIRVPTLAWWPGTIAPNTVVNAPTISYDWLPTFTELAGFPAPVRSDGVSLFPSLANRGQQRPSLVYLEYFNPGSVPRYPDFRSDRRQMSRNQMQMVRLGDTVGVRYNIQSADDDFEIYDVVNDPQQAKNLAGRHTDLQQYMKDRVLQVRLPNSTAARPYDSVAVPAIRRTVSVAPGLKRKTYRTDTHWIPETSGLVPLSVSDVASLEVKDIGSNMVTFEGYLKVPADGVYTFSLKTDGRAFVKVHDISLLDADYGYLPMEETMNKLRLKEGYHPVRIYYKTENQRDKRVLDLQWSYEGGHQTKIYGKHPFIRIKTQQ